MTLCPECKHLHDELGDLEEVDLAWMSTFAITIAIALLLGLGAGMILAGAWPR